MSNGFTAQVCAGTLSDVTDPDWPFGPFLAAAVRESGLSQREIGRRAGISPRRVAQLIERGPTTVEMVELLSVALGFDFHQGVALAGLQVPKNRHLLTDPITKWTVSEMLTALGDRFEELEAASTPAASSPQAGFDINQLEDRAVPQVIDLMRQLRADATASRNAGNTGLGNVQAYLADHLEALFDQAAGDTADDAASPSREIRNGPERS